MSKKKALVLAGGSVKGAFQAGVVAQLFNKGFEPDVVYGISAGSMNATFITNYLGKQLYHTQKVDYPNAGKALKEFWLENISSPDSLARRRSTAELGLSALRRNFEGLLDTTPLKEMLQKTIDEKYLKQSPVELIVGAVDVQKGSIDYINQHSDHFLDFVLASSSLPIIMPVIKVGGDKQRAYLDGCLRDVAPIRKAILDGAQEIVVVACHTTEMVAMNFDYANLLALVDRIMDITVNESLNNDLEWAEMFQKLNNTKLDLKVIKPQTPLAIDIQNFTHKDILNMINFGESYSFAK
jgi:NTE family protein